MLSTAGVAAPSADTDTLVPGAKAGPWVIDAQLGRGGMGAVYGVTHEDIGKRAALKVMHRALVSDVAAERILTEARVVNHIGHANIVDIFETGQLADGRLYIVMERLEGRPLGAFALEGKLLPDRVIAILLQICDALIAAHAAGVVHRDLKLDNVFLIENPDDPAVPKVKVLDWGIAKELANDVRQTIDGQLVGTPQYLSPEQARGLDVGPPSDVYSLGVLAYELFLEQLPFEAETAAEVMTMHLRALPPEPSELWPEIPHLLEKLLLQMLAKKPEQRPSMQTVAATLEHVRDELAARRQALSSEPVVIQPRHARARTSAPALAATQLAGKRFGRAWRVLAGALALCAAAAMFGLAHDSDATAAARTSASLGAVNDKPIATPPLATTTAAPIVPAATPMPTAPPLVIPVSAPVRAVPHRAAPHSHAPAVAPHHDQAEPTKLDRDGTIDPYS
jgi:tRNA A-37 threonylcarbamoyl transferase component Bud32